MGDALAGVIDMFRVFIGADNVSMFANRSLYKGDWTKIICLMRLIRLGGSSTPTELGKGIVRPKNYMTFLLKGMVAQGLVTRTQYDKKKVVHIKITKKGLSYLMQIVRNTEKIQQEILLVFKPEEISLLISLIRKFRDQFIDILIRTKDSPKANSKVRTNKRNISTK